MRRGSRAGQRLVSLVVLATATACGACSLDFTRYIPGREGGVTLDGSGTDARDRAITETSPPLDVVDVPVSWTDVVDADDAVISMPDTGCGGIAQTCCTSGMNGGCADGSQCVSGSCAACGGALQPCCGGTSCSGAGLCISGMCRTDCGAVAQPCCAGAMCAGSSVACISGTCMPCGTVSQHCCASAVCNAGSFCTTRPANWMDGACVECGHFGQLCCSTGPACAEGTCQATASGDSVCLGAATATAGGYCPPSAAGLYCMDGSICTPDNYCESCGGFFEPCCGGVDCATSYACVSMFCE